MSRVALSAAVVDSGVIAVLRAGDAADYLPVCRALVAAGVVGLELTLTTPRTIAELPALRAELPDAVLGVGTVTSPREAEAAIAAGAEFLVTPVTAGDVIRVATDAQVAIVPGGLTPTELLTGWEAGASAVKIFPASTVGSGYLAQLKGPFPDMLTVPSGGVGIGDIDAWIRAGALAVSLGGPLLGDAFRGGSAVQLHERARQALEAVSTARSASR